MVPGWPCKNPYVESFGSRVRDELLGVELFSCLAEARVMVADWREDYNEHRPHSALGMKAPVRFAKAWRRSAENGRPITLGDSAQGRRSPQNAPSSTSTNEIEPARPPGA